jgi:SAM-dependent methyltransferase
MAPQVAANDNGSIAETYRQILVRVLDARLPGYSPWFYEYCGSYPSTAEKYVQYHSDLLALAGISVEGKRVLDCGCGFAPTLILYGLFGAVELHGVEIHDPMVTTVLELTPLLPDRIRGRLHVVQGTVADLPQADGSIDLVISNEALSHYLDTAAFLREVERVLAPGGTLIVADSNNALNPSRRREVFHLWERFETGFHAPEREGIVSDKHYALKRYEIVREAFPELSHHDARDLALCTSGMTSTAVRAAAASFVNSRQFPEHRYVRGQVAVDPAGQVLERLLNPFTVVRDLRALGLDAKAYGYWGGAAGNPAVRLANRVLQTLSRATIWTTPSFRIVAVKAA